MEGKGIVMDKKLIIDQLISTPEIAAHEEDCAVRFFIGDSNKSEQPSGRYRFVPTPLDVPNMFPDDKGVAKLKQDYGIPDHVRGFIRNTWSRCVNCSKIQPAGSLMLWVADGLLPADDYDLFIAHCNGPHSSGWCVECFPKPSAPRPTLAGFWAFLCGNYKE
jgi:hypothetical protein